MYHQDCDQRGQDVDGLDMFVGSGIDFLSEVTMDDMDKELFTSNVTASRFWSPQNFINFAPLAASLGPPGTTLGFDYQSDIFGSNQSSQRPLAEDHASAAPLPSGMPQHLLVPACSYPHRYTYWFGAGVSHCMPPQSSGNPLSTQLRPDSEDPSNGEAGTSGELQDPGDGSIRPSETADAKAKLRDKNKRAQQRFRERKKASLPDSGQSQDVHFAVTALCNNTFVTGRVTSIATNKLFLS